MPAEPAAPSLLSWLLVVARVLPAGLWIPFWAPAGGPRLVAGVVAVAIGVALAPLALAGAQTPPLAALPAALVRELLLGLTFALAAGLPLRALGWSGRLAQRGWGLPLRPSGPVAQLFLWTGLWLFVALGGHRGAVLAFARGLEHAPVGAPGPGAAALGWGALRLVADAFGYALAWALPALGALWLFDLGWALVARARGPGGGFEGTAVAPRPWVATGAAGLALAAALDGVPTAVRAALDGFERLLAS